MQTVYYRVEEMIGDDDPVYLKGWHSVGVIKGDNAEGRARGVLASLIQKGRLAQLVKITEEIVE